MTTNRATSSLESTLSRRSIAEVPVFEPDPEGGIWQCPFCDDSPFSIETPPPKYTQAMAQVRIIIADHIRHHRTRLLEQLSPAEVTHYEKMFYQKQARVHEWIDRSASSHNSRAQSPVSGQNRDNIN